MKLGTVTRWGCLIVILTLVVWTSICAIWGAPGDTVSETVLAHVTRYPFLQAAAGFLLGHWFWPQRPPGCTCDNRPPLL